MLELRNPAMLSMTVDTSSGKPVSTLHISLTPDALLLRARYRGLILHYHNVSHPVFFDLGEAIALQVSVLSMGPVDRIVSTAYGLRPDGLLELVWRNWGDPAHDGLPRG